MGERVSTAYQGRVRPSVRRFRPVQFDTAEMMRSALSRRGWQFGLLVVFLVMLLTAAFWNYTQDDVFITYTYSRNIAQGHGFVYNPGERVQGTTTPLYALLMAGVYLVTGDMLHAGNLLSAAFLLVTIGLAADLTRLTLSIYARLALAITLAASPLVYVSFGMETLLYCALLMLAFSLWERDHHPAAMLATAALTWTRADGIVLGATFGLVALWEAVRASTRRTLTAGSLAHALPWRLSLVYLAAIAPWFLFAWVYFGTPLPQTFQAKQELFAGTQFLQDGRFWWESFYGNNALTLLAVPLIVFGMWLALRQPRLRPLTVWSALYLAGYVALNVTAFWYYTPLLVVLIVLAALGGDFTIRRLRRIGLDRRIVLYGSSGLVVLVSGLAAVRAWDYRNPPPRMNTYRLVGEWIHQNTSPGDTLLIKDLGIVGYYAQRPTLDSFGLIVPEMYDTHDPYAVAKYKPDWVVTTQYWEMQRMAAQDWFQYHYVPVVQFSTRGDGEFSPMTVFRRRLALAPPAQAVEGLDLPLTCTVTLDKGAPLPGETRAHLLSESGSSLVEVSHPFLWGQYPAARTLGLETLIEQIALPLAVPPGRYIWELDCDRHYSGEVDVQSIDQATGYTAVGAEWPGIGKLAGIALPEGTDTWSGGSLLVVLQWEASGSTGIDDSVFVHLVGQRVEAQLDGPPPSWSPGKTVIDVRRVVLPPNLSAGEYHLTIGWYDWRTNTRFTLTDGSDTLNIAVAIHNQWPGGSGLP
jgi:hypothetical protein